MISTALKSDIANLEPMPASVVQLARMLSDYASHIDEIVKVIELDLALTANVLRLANSAWSASAYPTSTVRAAVVRLGLARIVWYAVGTRVAKPMAAACPGYQLAEGELWRHSVAAALAAEQIGRTAEHKIPGAAFTGSLLHDLGKLVLSRHLADNTLARVSDLVIHENLTYVQAERRLLGTDHAEVGGAIALAWRFPQPLVAAIARHHDLDEAGDDLRDVIHVSNAVTKLIGIGLGSEEMNLAVDERSPRRLGLSATDLEATCANVSDDLTRVSGLCGGSKTHGT